MNADQQKLHDFFDAYESRMNKAIAVNPVVDIEAAIAAFADYFVEASPVGVTGSKNDAAFREIIAAGFAFYRSIGTKSMSMTHRAISRIDDYHWMVKAQWRARYQKPDSTQDLIDFEVVYFVQCLDGTPKIFAYITGDEQRVLREHGLITTPEPAETEAV